MSHSVSQEIPADQHHFSVTYLREFVASANKLGLPDKTEMNCITFRDGRVFSLSTHPLQELEDDPHSGATTAESKLEEVATARVTERTGVAQNATGPVESWRRWFKTHIARRLTLGDVRQLLAQLDALGVPTDQYAVFALRVPGSGNERGLVYNISARPKPVQANARYREGSSRNEPSR